MELILTQLLLLVVTIATVRIVMTMRNYSTDFEFITVKLRLIQKELEQQQYYPQPEDFKQFDKDFNEAPNPYFHEPHEEINNG
tara:strand:+ start:1249 stop:1497 length:249 start_codon:yes stop_codon:yes gene_type:complete